MAKTPAEPSILTSSLTAVSMVNSSQGLKISLTELNPHFVCVLCFGYFVDATTITECMHTFCRSCIVNFLKTNHHCPHCDTMLSRTRPFNSLRQDRMMQTLVYKTVPGLFQTEMRRRIQFYQSHPHSDFEPDVEDIQNYIFGPEDSVSLSIRYYNAISQITGDDFWDAGLNDNKDNLDADDINAIRYFRCPATVPMSVLKALVKTKYGIPDPFRVELLYGEERLLDTWTLMEVAYIFKWNRDSPMELSFQVFVTRKVKRKRLRLVKKPKVKDKGSGSTLPLENPEESLVESQDEDDTCREPPLKIPRIEEPKSPFSSSPEEHHQRPPTPPETPDGPADINMYTDHSKSPKSPVWFPSPSRDDSGSLKIVLQTKVSPAKLNASKTSSSEEDEPKDNSTQSEMDPFDKLMEEGTDSKYIESNSRYDPDVTGDNEDCPMDEDGDSGDYAGDQDSEAPLEVDTSHETEPEADNDGDQDYSQGDASSYRSECRKEEDMDEEEQGDSAIDVTENSASEVVDSDEKDTDFNMSSESIDMDNNHGIKVRECSSTSNKDCLIKSEEIVDYDSVNGNHKEETKESEASNADMSGALDLSCHARSVRAQRENSQSPVTSSSNSLSDNETRIQGLQALLAASQNGTPRQSPNGSPMHGQQSPLLKTSTCTVSGTNILTTSSISSPRPPLPLDWVRPPMGSGPVAPHAAAFNLMTLSHAAVQLQLAMAHAQAQAQAQAHAQAHAQAQVQAQAQKIQAQVQANVLKNLKATETLSFVNGSGDTLTISPIPCSQGNVAKSKLSTKIKSTKSISTNPNNLSYKSNPKSKGVNNRKPSKSSKVHIFQNGGNTLNNSENNSAMNTNRNSPNTNNNTTSTNNNSNNTVQNIQKTNNSVKSPQTNRLKTIIPKSALTALRIPTVSLNSKSHLSKSEREKKQEDKERTGDPVFKITNQKLIEFVRQQHLHKLKQSIKQNSSIDESTYKNSNNCTAVTPNGSSKPTLAVDPTSVADSSTKTNTNNSSSNKVTKNDFVSKPTANNIILNKPQASSTNKSNSSVQSKPHIASISKSHPISLKPQSSINKPQQTQINKLQSSLNKSQPSTLNRPTPPSLNKSPLPSLNRPLPLNLNKTPTPILANKPQSPSRNKPQSPSLNKPQSPSLNKPQSPSLNKPQSPSLNKPLSPSLNKPLSTSLNKPLSTSLNKSQFTNLNKPQSPSLNKPQSLSLNKPHPLSINKPPSLPNKAPNNLMTKSSPVLNKSPMITLNKLSVNSMLKPAAVTTPASQPINSLTANSLSTNVNTKLTNNTILNGSSTNQSNGEGSQSKPLISPAPKQLTLTSSTATSTASTIRTTNTNVRQIPNPSRLTHQSENRISSGISRLGTMSKKGVTSSKSEGMSRIESLTRSLHEKVAAASGVSTGVLNSLAR